ADRENEPELTKSRWIKIVVILYEGLSLWMIAAGVNIAWFYYDRRFAFPVRIMFWGNILLPAVSLLWTAFWFFRRKKINFQQLLPGLLVCAVLNAFAAASVPALTKLYYLSLHGGIFNQYLLFILIHLVFFISSLIYLTASFIAAWKEKSPEYRYHGENLFFFGQILSKLDTSSKTMTLICITLVLAIFLFIAAPVLTGWASGYLDIRSM